MSDSVKRKNRGYKATEKSYLAAMKQAKKDKLFLAQMIEAAIELYGKTSYWPDGSDLLEQIRFNNG